MIEEEQTRHVDCGFADFDICATHAVENNEKSAAGSNFGFWTPRTDKLASVDVQSSDGHPHAALFGIEKPETNAHFTPTHIESGCGVPRPQFMD